MIRDKFKVAMGEENARLNAVIALSERTLITAQVDLKRCQEHNARIIASHEAKSAALEIAKSEIMDYTKLAQENAYKQSIIDELRTSRDAAYKENARLQASCASYNKTLREPLPIDAVMQKVVDFIKQGAFIDGIKAMRSLYPSCIGLKEAKNAVEILRWAMRTGGERDTLYYSGSAITTAAGRPDMEEWKKLTRVDGYKSDSSGATLGDILGAAIDKKTYEGRYMTLERDADAEGHTTWTDVAGGDNPEFCTETALNRLNSQVVAPEVIVVKIIAQSAAKNTRYMRKLSE